VPDGKRSPQPTGDEQDKGYQSKGADSPPGPKMWEKPTVSVGYSNTHEYSPTQGLHAGREVYESPSTTRTVLFCRIPQQS
jgi:hypothetical protein